MKKDMCFPQVRMTKSTRGTWFRDTSSLPSDFTSLNTWLCYVPLQNSSLHRWTEKVHHKQEATTWKRGHQAATSETFGIRSCSGQTLNLSSFWTCLWRNYLFFCSIYSFQSSRFLTMNLKNSKTRRVWWSICTRKSSLTVTGWVGENDVDVPLVEHNAKKRRGLKSIYFFVIMNNCFKLFIVRFWLWNFSIKSLF